MSHTAPDGKGTTYLADNDPGLSGTKKTLSGRGKSYDERKDEKLDKVMRDE